MQKYTSLLPFSFSPGTPNALVIFLPTYPISNPLPTLSITIYLSQSSTSPKLNQSTVPHIIQQKIPHFPYPLHSFVLFAQIPVTVHKISLFLLIFISVKASNSNFPFIKTYTTTFVTITFYPSYISCTQTIHSISLSYTRQKLVKPPAHSKAI